jgi:hypothetical protein
MRQISALLLCAIVALSLGCVAPQGQAEEFKSADLYYVVRETGATSNVSGATGYFVYIEVGEIPVQQGFPATRIKEGLVVRKVVSSIEEARKLAEETRELYWSLTTGGRTAQAQR